MKYTAAVLLLALACAGTHAQDLIVASFASHSFAYNESQINTNASSPLISPLYIQRTAPVEVMASGKEKALRKKVIGMSMVGMGVTLQVAGVLMFKSGYDEAQAAKANHRPGEKYYDGDGKQYLGVFMCLGGFGVAIPGTILWIKGAHSQKLYKDYPSMTSSLTFRPGINPSLCYRF